MSESRVAMAPCIIVKGLTLSGELFRPSDWAQRLALAAAVGTCPTEQRLCYRPEVRVTALDGVPAIFIDRRLEQSDPLIFTFLLEFARLHELQCAA
ncbi:MAG TPA: DUF3579 domain-containing protein [Gammaproteobacteria bacterium]